MKLLNEFKQFAMKGNIVDLAVAVIIGAAFGKIISSFVADVLMPPIGLLVGGVDFTGLAITLKEGETPDQAVLLNYGKFVQTVVDFTIVAFSVFMVIKAYNISQKKKEEAPASPPAPTRDQELLAEIRDLLKNK
jgi:large conductance mechanosensitive channel